MLKRLKWNHVIMSVLYIALGIFLLVVPGTALNVVCYALGGIVLAGAVVQLVRYFTVERGVWRSQFTLVSGLVCLGLGAFLILRSDLVVRALPVVFGLFVVFDSLVRVQNALELRRCQYNSWKGFLLLALLSVVLGIRDGGEPLWRYGDPGHGHRCDPDGGRAGANLLSAAYTAFAVRRFMKMHPEAQSVLEGGD